jgi:hypothetical protein
MTLTEQAQHHAKLGDFERCLEQISERQILLERLQKMLEQQELLNYENPVKTAYLELILSVKSKDNVAISLLAEQRIELRDRFTQQSKVKKAMSAYHNVLLSK